MSAQTGKALDKIEQGKADEAVLSIISILNNPPEVQSIRQCGDRMKSLNDEMIQHRMDVQNIIQNLLSLKEGQGASVEASTSEEENVKDVEKELSDACKEMEKIQEEAQVAQKEKYEIEGEQARLMEQREALKDETINVLPKTRYNINLFTCITRIRWDYECPPEQIKGYVSTDTDVRPFSLSKHQNSKFFITNYLWDLVAAASQTK